MTAPSSVPPARILIADDHAIAREGLRAMLGRRNYFQVVGEARDGEEAIARFDELRPDVRLLDLRMPRRDGFAVLTALEARTPPPGVPGLTTYGGGEDVHHVLTAVAFIEVVAEHVVVDTGLKPPARSRNASNTAACSARGWVRRSAADAAF